jgi:hypothetical protein
MAARVVSPTLYQYGWQCRTIIVGTAMSSAANFKGTPLIHQPNLIFWHNAARIIAQVAN